MSHPLKNMMCDENVPGDHTDGEAMDWAADELADSLEEAIDKGVHADWLTNVLDAYRNKKGS